MFMAFGDHLPHLWLWIRAARQSSLEYLHLTIHQNIFHWWKVWTCRQASPAPRLFYYKALLLLSMQWFNVVLQKYVRPSPKQLNKPLSTVGTFLDVPLYTVRDAGFRTERWWQAEWFSLEDAAFIISYELCCRQDGGFSGSWIVLTFGFFIAW